MSGIRSAGYAAKLVKSYIRNGKRVKGYTRKPHNHRSRSSSRSRSGGNLNAGGEDYFQDYAHVGGAAMHPLYDSYATYDPRVAGAYDYAYDPRVAGAYDMYYDAPRMAGAQMPIDPYAEWAQARYAGNDFGVAPPLLGAGDMDLTAGNYMRAKPGKKKKTVEVHTGHKTKSKSKSASRKRGGIAAPLTAGGMFEEAFSAPSPSAGNGKAHPVKSYWRKVKGHPSRPKVHIKATNAKKAKSKSGSRSRSRSSRK